MPLGEKEKKKKENCIHIMWATRTSS